MEKTSGMLQHGSGRQRVLKSSDSKDTSGRTGLISAGPVVWCFGALPSTSLRGDASTLLCWGTGFRFTSSYNAFSAAAEDLFTFLCRGWITATDLINWKLPMLTVGCNPGYWVSQASSPPHWRLTVKGAGTVCPQTWTPPKSATCWGYWGKSLLLTALPYAVLFRLLPAQEAPFNLNQTA